MLLSGVYLSSSGSPLSCMSSHLGNTDCLIVTMICLLAFVEGTLSICLRVELLLNMLQP